LADRIVSIDLKSILMLEPIHLSFTVSIWILIVSLGLQVKK